MEPSLEECNFCYICEGWGGWTTEQIRGPHGVSLWKDIYGGWDCFSYSSGLMYEMVPG